MEFQPSPPPEEANTVPVAATADSSSPAEATPLIESQDTRAADAPSQKDILDTQARKEEEEMDELLKELKPLARQYADEHAGDQDWLYRAITSADSPDQLISHLRHIPGGQEWGLREILKRKPDLMWYRGGTKITWGERFGAQASKFYTDEENNTPVLDKGANGAFNRKALAVAFLGLSRRETPVVYSIRVADFLRGLEKKAIKLMSEHEYDLRVLQEDPKEYIAFCKEYLHIEDMPYEE